MSNDVTTPATAKRYVDPAAASGAAASDAAAPRTRLIRDTRWIAGAMAVWAFAYACYRAYYAFGGQFGSIGRPTSESQFRAINAFGAAVIFVAAALPLIAAWNQRQRWVRRLAPVIAWCAAVGCCMHALVNIVLRVLSLAGLHAMDYPPDVWLSINRRVADLQDLFLNEPWFFIEGCAWAALGLSFVAAGSRRRWGLAAVVACVLATGMGVLSGLGVIGSLRFF